MREFACAHHFAQISHPSKMPASARLFALAQVGMFSTVRAVAARVEASFVAGLVGDALALGGHYEYDAKKINEMVGSYTDYLAPGQKMGGATHGVGWGAANYHPGKVAGDGTDSGEVAVMLLEHLVEAKGRYTFDGYAAYWKAKIDEGYGSCNFQSVGRNAQTCPPNTKPGYLNGATRRTLEALASNPHAKGRARQQLAADTNCLVAATHFLPLFLVSADEEELVAHARTTVYLSHKNRDPLAAAEFLTRALYGIIHRGEGLRAALESAARVTGDAFITARLADAVRKVEEATDPSGSSSLSKVQPAWMQDDTAITSMARLWDVGKSEPIRVGKASPTEGALPASLYFALKYEASGLEAALTANANVGGDSAVRGMTIGMLLGAVHGLEGMPERWTTGLRSLPHVTRLFAQLREEAPPAATATPEL